MEKRETIRTFLGTSQNEMAVLLNVSMGQWSMYESGKRKLPAQAMLLLAEMVEYMQKPEATGKDLIQLTKNDAEKKKLLESLLTENQFELLKVSRKAAAMEKKQERCIKALQLTQFLHSKAQNKNIKAPQIVKAIEARAANQLSKNGVQQLMILRAKEELLKLQQEWLTKELARL